MSDSLSYPGIPKVHLFGIPLSRLGFAETVSYIDSLAVHSKPAFFITAPLHYAMLCRRMPSLEHVNQKAAFVVADGMPLVWLSRLKGRPIAERVTGSDLMPAICQLAASNGQSVFLLGAAPGVGQRAADKLRERFPELRIAGVECPQMSELSDSEEQLLVRQIRDSGANYLFVARGQPAGEIWLAKHYQELNCVSVQIGASIDFVAGGLARAPRWMQRTGLEWVYRISREPRRLVGRYLSNALFLLTHAPRELLS